MNMAMRPIIDEIMDYMDEQDPLRTQTETSFFMQGDGERDEKMYEFVWALWQAEKRVMK